MVMSFPGVPLASTFLSKISLTASFVGPRSSVFSPRNLFASLSAFIFFNILHQSAFASSCFNLGGWALMSSFKVLLASTSPLFRNVLWSLCLVSGILSPKPLASTSCVYAHVLASNLAVKRPPVLCLLSLKVGGWEVEFNRATLGALPSIFLPEAFGALFTFSRKWVGGCVFFLKNKIK